MKEITRIHIAKVPYDIEVSARKNLEKYMASLEAYAAEPDVYDDIEIRVTELLSERGITKDGVIGDEDVRAIREQLGEPEEFAEMEGDIATGAAVSEGTYRRLYRNQDQAVLGGVLSGIATYFNVNPLWTRLIFMLVLFISFGSAALVYVVLWIAVPPARTAAEKLQLEGKPVTLAAIKDYGERFAEVTAGRTSQTLQKVLLFGLGLFFSVIATGALAATTIIGVSFFFGIGTSENSPFADVFFNEGGTTLAFALFVVSGLLFAALNAILAVAAFSRRWTKRIGISIVAIVVAGIIAFGSGVGSFMYGSWQREETVRQSMTTSTKQLSSDFHATKDLTIDVSRMSSTGVPTVVYIVSADAPHAEFAYPKGYEPKLQMKQNGKVATATLTLDGDASLPHYVEPMVRVYGPALDKLSVKGGGTVKYVNDQRQKAITFDAADGATIISEGVFTDVDVRTKGNASVSLTDAAVTALRIVNDGGGSVEAGVIRDLNVTQPDACPAPVDDSQNRVRIEAISGTTITYNGAERLVKSAATIQSPCGAIIIGNEEDEA